MPHAIMFRTGWAKRALGWFVILVASVALVELGRAMAIRWQTLPAAEIWSGVFIGLFVLAFAVMGFAIQDMRWTIDSTTIRIRRFLRWRSVELSDLAGYGTTIIVVGVFPILHIDLYDRDLKPVMRLPIDRRDVPKAERLLADHLRPVVNDGSLAMPRRRFGDLPEG